MKHFEFSCKEQKKGAFKLVYKQTQNLVDECK